LQRGIDLEQWNLAAVPMVMTGKRDTSMLNAQSLTRLSIFLSLLWLSAALTLPACGSSTDHSGSGGSGGSGAGGSPAGQAGNGGSTGNGGTGGVAGAPGGHAGSAAGAGGGGAGSVGAGGSPGTGGATGTGGGGAAGAGTGAGGATAFALTSNTLAEGAMFPIDSTCETTMAASQMPDLHWTGAPAGTRSFALAFVDVSLIPANTNGYHSVLWDVPPTVTTLPYGLPAGSPPVGVAGLESVKQKKAPSGAAWLGPCPNFPSTTRTKTDNYELRLYALDVDALPSNITSMNVAGMIKAIEALPPRATAVLGGKSNAAAAMLK
jgi:phosphatidylethanolamine-binding protein (PEBP) family uncharacterized protein